MKYYELKGDRGPDGWYLGDLNVRSKKMFDLISGVTVDVRKYKNLKTKVYDGTIPPDYNETLEDLRIVSENFADLLYEYGQDIQLIPVTPEPTPHSKINFYVLVLKHVVECIDESRAEYELYDQEDAPNPTLVGAVKHFMKLKIDPKKVKHAIFRLARYEIMVIVNEEIKKKLEASDLIGFKFKLVS